MPAIEVLGVAKWFGSLQALSRIDLTVQEGEFVSLVGPSGCGKTTLLRIVAGLEEPTEGTVLVVGVSPREACKNHSIGVAFQQPALVPSRTARRNVDLTRLVTGTTGVMVPADMLLAFGLDRASLDKYPHQLSGGMQQRVDLACAMIHNPDVLLLDEPFGPLDEQTREIMGEWLGGVLAESRQAVLFVTHSVEEAVLLSDRVLVMSTCPARFAGCVEIDLPFPRSRSLRTTSTFLDYVIRVREILYTTMDGQVDGEVGR
jgi:NitT/TauT family transport system ATP-binding protein